MLWSWATFFLDRDRLPQRRVLVRFDYPTLSVRRGWLLIERGDAEICEKYPGGEEHLVVVVNDPVAFARWHMGELAWGDALRARAIVLQGSRALARALPTWRRDHDHGPAAGGTASNRPRPRPARRRGPRLTTPGVCAVRSAEAHALHLSTDGTEVTIDLSATRDGEHLTLEKPDAERTRAARI